MDKVAYSNENVEETHLVMLKPSKHSDTCFKQACMMRDPLELLDSSCEEIIKDEPTIKKEAKREILEIDHWISIVRSKFLRSMMKKTQMRSMRYYMKLKRSIWRTLPL